MITKEEKIKRRREYYTKNKKWILEQYKEYRALHKDMQPLWAKDNLQKSNRIID